MSMVHHCQLVTTHVMYSGGDVFESRPYNKLLCLSIIVLFLSRQLLGQQAQLKSGYELIISHSA
jgi:hypothetical protein